MYKKEQITPLSPPKWLTKEECDERGVCYQELDVQGNLLEVNQAWLDFSGLSKNKVIGRFVGEFVSNDSLANIEKNFPVLKDYGEVNHIHVDFISSDKQTTDVLLFGRSEYDHLQNFVKTHCWFAPIDYFFNEKSNFLNFVNELEDVHRRMREKTMHLDWTLNSINAFVISFEDSHIKNVNKPVLDFFDCKTSAEFSQVIPDDFKQALLNKVQNGCSKSLLIGDPCFELLNAKTQQTHFFDCQVTPVIFTENESIIVLNDITSTIKLNNEKELSANYLNVAKVMIVALDRQANIKLINQSGLELLGYSKNELIGKNWFDTVIYSDDIPALKAYFKSLVLGDVTAPEYNENVVLTKSGEQRVVSWHNTVLKDDFGQIIGTISSAEDITELKHSQKELEFLAHHDVLTGLDNRNSFEIRLDQAIKKADRHQSSFAVCFIDLDNFKYINDSQGHKTGDELLIAVANTLKSVIRDSDTPARFGGDEFVVLLDEIKHESEVATTAQKLINSFKKPFNFSDYSMMITMSMGVSVYPNDADDVDHLLQNADIAMYEAKHKGKNQFALYNHKMAANTIKRAQLIQELTQAISAEQFMVYYQPQIDQSNQKVVGIEALVRWEHPTKGMVLPDEFIPLAEEAGLMVALGEQVLRKACQDITLLHNETTFDGYVSINISGTQIESKQFLSTLEKVLAETGVKPSLLEMEITESVVMSHPDQWIALFKRLKSIGLKIAIDDFGTGYSSLSQLSKLPLDKLKIDKSFINDLAFDEKARTVAQAIINLSHSMNMTSIAEGVETEAQKQFLEQQNCKIGQGFLFAKPMPLLKLKTWLSQSIIQTA